MSFQPKKLLIVSAIWMAITTQAAYAVDLNLDSLGKEGLKVYKEKLSTSELGALEKNSEIYYKLGGARPLSVPPSHNANLKVEGKAKFGAGYSCGQFDPSASLQNFFNDIQNGVDDAMNTMSQAASSAIAGLPALALSRNSPDLYELLQTNVFRAEEEMKFNAASCEEIERQIAAGENPYKQWTEMAQATTLDEESESNPDVNDAMEKVGKNAGDDGVNLPIPGKGIIKAGGKGQDPIAIVSMATVTGYNIILKRENVTTLSKPTKDAQIQTKLVSSFSSPEIMRDWAVELLGEQEIYTTKTPKAIPKGQSGIGLTGVAMRMLPLVEEKLMAAYEETDDEERILLLSEMPGNTIVTSDLVEKIKAFDMSQNMIQTLADEVTLGLVIDRAILLRRVLISSLSEHNIAAVKPAKDAIEDKIKLLEAEIQQTSFEYDIRHKLVKNLANSIYESQAIQEPGRKSNVGQKESSLPQMRVK
ncbi:MAG: integrating conjugative element protein [Pedobacter sp.]